MLSEMDSPNADAQSRNRWLSPSNAWQFGPDDVFKRFGEIAFVYLHHFPALAGLNDFLVRDHFSQDFIHKKRASL